MQLNVESARKMVFFKKRKYVKIQVKVKPMEKTDTFPPSHQVLTHQPRSSG